MKKSGRYKTSHLVEDQYQPGSGSRVLRNLPGIQRKREMDKIEGQEQARALEELVGIYGKSHRFIAADVCRIHQAWLARIYSWAGKYRQVALSPFVIQSVSRIFQGFGCCFCTAIA